MNDRTALDPEAPHLPVLARGRLGHLFPWVLCQHGDNLRFAIGRYNDPDEHTDIDITTPAELEALQELAVALIRAAKGGAP